MKKLLVSLVVVYACYGTVVRDCPAEPYFSDGFETNNLSGWDNSRIDAGCSAAATGEEKNTGSYSVSVDDNNPANTQWYSACVEKVIGPLGGLYARFHVFLKAGFLGQLNGSGWEEAKIFRLNTHLDGAHVVLSVNRSGGVNRFILSESIGWTVKASTAVPQENAWYCFEIRVDSPAVSTSIDWWINEVQQGSFSGIDMSPGEYWDWIRAGIFECTMSTYVHGVYIDDVAVSETYNGPAVPGPDSPPTVSITSPGDGDTVSGIVNITADAADDDSIDRVEFYIDGQLEGTDNLGPDYSYSWDTTQYSDSVHSLKATAYDSIGQATDSQLSVTVNNGTAPENDDHVWLHVEGQYLRTSPLADPPNAIWMGAGVNWGCGTYYGEFMEYAPFATDFDGTAANWIKSKGCNHVRIAFQSLPYPQGSPGGQGGIPGQGGGLSIQATIDQWLSPAVEQLKDRQIYSSLDLHEQFQLHIATREHLEAWNDRPNYTQEDVDVWLSHWVAIATHFKDEPWVMAYEPVNEPAIREFSPYPPAESFYTGFRNFFLQGVEAIRQIDIEHVIICPTWWGHIEDLEPMWGAIDFRADEPWGNVSFAIHPYYHVNEDNGWAPGMCALLDYLQGTYGISIMNTEFGNLVCCTFPLPTPEQMIADQESLINYCYDRRIPWSIWAMNTGEWPRNYEYEEAWVPYVTEHASPPPVPGGTAASAGKLECSVYPLEYLMAGSTETVTVKATVKDALGNRVQSANNTVTFSLSGNATWTDGSSAPGTSDAFAGNALMDIKPGSSPGSVTVTVSAEGLVPDSVKIPVIGPPAWLRVTVSAKTIPADGNTTVTVASRIKDVAGNTCENILKGVISYEVTPANLGTTRVFASSTVVTSRDLSGAGLGYILFQPGTEKGTAVVTASYGSVSGSVMIGVGTDPGAFPNLNVYPNMVVSGESGARMRFTGLDDTTEVKIYTITGRLVRRLQQSDFGDSDMTWDVMNMEGAYVKRGIYLYSATNTQGEKKTGKVIIR